MKRYKVVQASTGEWGIWDTRAWVLDADFASWGGGIYTGADRLDEIVTGAARLNQVEATRKEFSWEPYLPRKENR